MSRCCAINAYAQCMGYKTGQSIGTKICSSPNCQLHWSYLSFVSSWLLLDPSILCHDYQMGAIPLITSFSDPRNLLTAITFGSIVTLYSPCLSSGTVFPCYRACAYSPGRISVVTYTVLTLSASHDLSAVFSENGLPLEIQVQVLL